MESQKPPVPNPSPQAPVDPPLAEAAGMSPPPPKRDSFVMSFISQKKNLFKFLPVIFVLFLVATLPLAVVLVRRRQLGESQSQVTPMGCGCESVTASKDLDNLSVGDVIHLTGMGKTGESDYDIDAIKFIVKKDGEEMAVEEKSASLDHQERDLRFYKSEEFSYVIREYGDYEVTIQVSCPGGWED